MTKPADKSPSVIDTMNAMFTTMVSFAPMGTMIAQRTLAMQEAVAGEMNLAAHRWLDRRQEAVASMVGTAQEVMDKGLTDTNALFGSMQEWYAGALERAAADFRSPYDLMMACSGHVLPPAPAPGQKTAASIRRAA